MAPFQSSACLYNATISAFCVRACQVIAQMSLITVNRLTESKGCFKTESKSSKIFEKMHDLPEKLPFLMIERPKMPRATWEALRTHIMRERQRKKQEQEQTQAVS
jgi:hypothetical protein